ncbi:hypothetical protein HanRHA438_Chr09g0418321 [Helianthus annuus]|nr:hypothetical protein HanRHA438_Chr09g0418321 [Helianthus annuus]
MSVVPMVRSMSVLGGGGRGCLFRGGGYWSNFLCCLGGGYWSDFLCCFCWSYGMYSLFVLIMFLLGFSLIVSVGSMSVVPVQLFCFDYVHMMGLYSGCR